MKIDLYQDTVCPWCRVGKISLDQALSKWGGEQVDIEIKAFLLDENVPKHGHDMEDYISWKFGSSEKVNETFELLKMICDYLGIELHYEKIKKVPNSTLSHKLIKGVPKDLQLKVLNDIQVAYFEDGKDIGDPLVLTEIANKIGLDKNQVEKSLSSDEYEDIILKDHNYARKLGVKAVPVYVINDEFVVSGAHAPDKLLEIMQNAQSNG